MKMFIYCVYDSKAEAYMQPFFMQTKGQAIRGFDDVCNDASTQFYKHPADFTLFELGSFDDSNGHIETYLAPVAIGNALEFKKVAPVSQPVPQIV